MDRCAGGSEVGSGYYLDVRSLAVVHLPDRGVLPGARRDSFVRIPLPVVLAAAPVVGGAFLVAWPVLALVTMAWGVARKVAGTSGGGVTGMAARRPRSKGP
jgi:hypothetical protein